MPSSSPGHARATPPRSESWSIGIAARSFAPPWRRSVPRADADDAAQEAFVTAYERLESFRGEASFKTWLLTIAWHHAINRR